MNKTNSPITRENIKINIDRLTVFSGLKKDSALAALREYLDNPSVAGYTTFVSAFYPSGADFALYVRDLVLGDDNFYVKKVAAGEKPDQEIEDSVSADLTALEDIAAISPGVLAGFMHKKDSDLSLPGWRNSSVDFARDFAQKLADIPHKGYGLFAEYSFFRITDKGITPVAHPDCQHLDQLYGYERERNLIIKNTEALIDGTGANNMLLYGDMGTGKSSSIKAVAAHYAARGLRLIEIKKDQLFQFPEIMDQLASNPLKFILFIDDLSFAGNDDNFSALKAALEGSVCGCGNNTVIYATSNRRHLVRESAADRSGFLSDDDLHVNDTLQETMSLSARFGLTITFSKPGKDDYLSIVRSLAGEYGIVISNTGTDGPNTGTDESMTETELFQKAEAFAIRKNGRSPRTAKQFIELLKIGM